MTNKIDSNVTGLFIAEESDLKTLPDSPVWYEQEPNSYSDLGGELTNVARSPITATRQRKKGVITDLDASGGFNTDITASNMTSLLQGFCFASAREKAGTATLGGISITLTSVDSATSAYQAASGLDDFSAGDLIFCKDFSNSENNGFKTVVSASAISLVVSDTLVDETPSTDAKFQTVGVQADDSDLNITVGTGSMSITSTALDFSALSINIGEYVFIGGDEDENQFLNNKGYGRVSEINANELVFDDTTFTPVAETGTDLSIQLFFGTVVRNEDTASLIKRRSYNIERQLGSDSDGTQSEYLAGAIANELTINIPQADKLNADLAFIALDSEQRTGSQGVKSGTRVKSAGESALNTSSDIYRIKLSVLSDTSTVNDALFGYVSEASITINNNVSANKAVAVLGAFDATVGDFEVGGSITAYFTEVAAIKAIRNNADVGLNFIAASDNKGMVYDIPLISLGGGQLTVEKDSSIMIPIDMTAAESDLGYTLLTTTFAYLPELAMPA